MGNRILLGFGHHSKTLSMVNVLICAFEDGISKLEDCLPQPRAGVNYFISWQGRGIDQFVIPESLVKRTDLWISKLEGIGLSRNRNNAIHLAQENRIKGFFLIADEDIEFVEGFEQVIESSFLENPKADILCFKVRTQEKVPFKNYSNQPFQLSIFSIDRVSSIEVAGRVEVLDSVQFDERLGLGARFPSGEETAFLADCLKLGKRIRFIPKFIVIHPVETSGKKRVNQFTNEALQLIGARAYRIYGRFWSSSFFLFSGLKNYPNYKNDQSFFSYLAALQNGMKEFKRMNNG